MPSSRTNLAGHNTRHVLANLLPNLSVSECPTRYSCHFGMRSFAVRECLTLASKPDMHPNIRIQACIVGRVVRCHWYWRHHFSRRVYICGQNTGLASSNGRACGEQDEIRLGLLLGHFGQPDSRVALQSSEPQIFVQRSKALPVPSGERR